MRSRHPRSAQAERRPRPPHAATAWHDMVHKLDWSVALVTKALYSYLKPSLARQTAIPTKARTLVDQKKIREHSSTKATTMAAAAPQDGAANNARIYEIVDHMMSMPWNHLLTAVRRVASCVRKREPWLDGGMETMDETLRGAARMILLGLGQSLHINCHTVSPWGNWSCCRQPSTLPLRRV